MVNGSGQVKEGGSVEFREDYDYLTGYCETKAFRTHLRFEAHILDYNPIDGRKRYEVTCGDERFRFNLDGKESSPLERLLNALNNSFNSSSSRRELIAVRTGTNGNMEFEVRKRKLTDDYAFGVTVSGTLLLETPGSGRIPITVEIEEKLIQVVLENAKER